MYSEQIRSLLEEVQNGQRSAEEAFRELKDLPYQDLGFAKVDHHRELRKGFPEVVFCQGKTTEQVLAIIASMIARGSHVMATRADAALLDEIVAAYPQAERHDAARIAVVYALDQQRPAPLPGKRVAVITAGTADIPVAEEAAITATQMLVEIVRIYDVGVAGIHRFFDHQEKLEEVQSIVVAAGMEGALASVVGGLAHCPVIAVPTSIGYGAHFHGLAALLSMLNTCASGVAVVNIDNGFGAGYVAAMIARQSACEAA